MARIGIVDADLLDRGTRFPNLALMKIAGFKRDLGDEVVLIENYNELSPLFNDFDKIYVSKVFDFTQIPINLKQFQNIEIGGTGFYGENAPWLPDKIEHHMPFYGLYDKYIEHEIKRGIKPNKFTDYQEYSIGFTTRGCFRKCAFCVNRRFDHVFKHSPVSEFLDETRKKIYLWDDNILGYPKWEEVFDELISTKKAFSFRQGMDIRLMTDYKAQKICKAKYVGDYTFAFDHLNEKESVLKGLNSWLKFATKQTRLYVLCGFDSQDANDIEATFERIKILMQHHCIPYIMRYAAYENSKYKGIYINLARWCNQPNFFKKKSFRQYCEENGESSSTMRYLNEFERDYPEIATRYFDIRFDKSGEK